MMTMIKKHRTKILLTAFVFIAGTVAYVGYSGPGSDRRFLLGCFIVCGIGWIMLMVVARVCRCPQCGADLGYFQGVGRFRRWRKPLPRYISCGNCGCTVDRWNDN